MLLLAALLIRVLLAAAYPPVIPGLSFVRSLIARESSSAVSNVIPGPSGTATQYVVLRSWGVSTERFAGATVSVSVLTDALVFAAPGTVLRPLGGAGPARRSGQRARVADRGDRTRGRRHDGGAGRRRGPQRAAGRAGSAAPARRCVNPLRRLFGKPPVTTWPDRAQELRTSTLGLVEGNARVLGGCIGGGYLLNGFLLVGCLWACGIDRDGDAGVAGPVPLLHRPSCSRSSRSLPAPSASPRWSTPRSTSPCSARRPRTPCSPGVLVYRALTWGLPLVTGAIAYLAWRIMRHREIHQATAGS